ncbi:MAG: hypothetical protein IKT52_14250 [Oscillospiraceae bacterium]|nr:hypothetical protein [Oscillospiraceae bacterium]MBR5233012.1 hypothetical protein [Clostridia bacterium]
MADQHDHWFFTNEHIANLLSLSEKIGNMVLSVNEAMARFAASDTFANLVKFFQSIPSDIQETELFQRISGFEKAEITYTDVEWLQESFGYMTYDMAVDAVRKKTAPTSLDTYVLSIVESTQLSHREKTIILLAHFEELVYQTMSHERKAKDKIKIVASQSAQDTHEMDLDSYKKVLIAGVVFTVFSNTDSYTNPIDKRIPFRNNILHRGMMDYSDEDAKSVYELLVYFIAELAIMATE